jgi:PPOX class probable F420-dependent enzyme
MDRRGQPYVVPVCFAFDGRCVFTPIDRKPKRVPPSRLRRVRNIESNRRVALIVDAYREDWRRLWYVLVLGAATVIPPGTAVHVRAVGLLRRKYRQYRAMGLEDSLVLRIVPRHITAWSADRPVRPSRAKP